MIALSVANLAVSLGGTPVLTGTDLDVASGQWAGLIGPNGAGKSTLLRAVLGLVESTGEIRIGSAPSRPEARDLARLVAYVPQTPVLPPGMTVSEYVLLGRTAHLGWLGRESANDRDEAAAALHRLELDRFARRDLDSLSGGEVQRVALARALASNCPILALDEPTSALDIGHQITVLELIDELRLERGLTIVSAMHDLTAAGRFCDHLILLSCGKPVASGPAVEVLTVANLSRYYQTPVEVLTSADGSVVVVPSRAASRQPTT